LKTNCDAALSKERKKAAFGVVVRNAEGGGVAASVTVVPFCLQERFNLWRSSMSRGRLIRLPTCWQNMGYVY
jgi:hypothetical protein